MTVRRKQLAAAVLGCSSAIVGFSAQLAPRSFYDAFPLPGHRWIASSGAFNEHLVRDVGGLYLAMTVVSVWAALRPTDEITRLAGVAWAIFSVPHLVFHAAHLVRSGSPIRSAPW